MKKRPKGILLVLGLLTSCGACEKQTIDGTTPNAPACLIATQRVKELISLSQPSRLDLETVSINGESFQVGTTKKSVYTYDKQGRILTEYNQYAAQKADSVYYQYTTLSVIIHKVNLATTPKTSSIQVVELNSQGFSEKRPNGSYATYDKDGYLLTLKGLETVTFTVDNGNVTETLFADNAAVPIYITKDEYDLSKPGLPSVQNFYGKASRNLPIKGTVDEKNHSYIISSVYMTTYVYVFDRNDRVSRQIIRGKDGDPPFLYGGSKLTVKDFTYISP